MAVRCLSVEGILYQWFVIVSEANEIIVVDYIKLLKRRREHTRHLLANCISD